MRPLRVHIDVTNGTATSAQPDPQPITSMLPKGISHRNGCQHQPLVRLPSLNLQGKNRRQEPLSWQKGPLHLPLPSHSARKNRSLRTGVQLFLPRQTLLPTLLEISPVLPSPTHHRPRPTLTLLAVLGCSRRQTFPPRQPALSVATTHGPPRTSFFALMVLSRPL